MSEQFKQLAAVLGVDVDIVFQRDVPWPAVPCEAYCAREITDEMRQHLVASGIYTRPKPLIVLTNNDLGVALHEMAHAAIAQPITATPSRLRRALVNFDFQETIAGRVVEGPPWQDHDAQFIRAGLHLLFRVVQHGYWWLRPIDLCLTGPRYGTSDVSDYMAALGTEPERCDSELLVEVLQRPAPAAFVQLFNDDTTETGKIA